MDDPNDETKAGTFILSQILGNRQAEAEHALACLQMVVDDIRQEQREVLVRRWTQIRDLVAVLMRHDIGAVHRAQFFEERQSRSTDKDD